METDAVNWGEETANGETGSGFGGIAAIAAWDITQTEAARRFGVTQPRLNDLLRSRIVNFSLEALVALAARSGLSVHLETTLAA